MFFRITDALSFSVEFEAGERRQFQTELKKALMQQPASKTATEIQFQDADGYWRLPIKNGVPSAFNPKTVSENPAEYWPALSSTVEHLIGLSEISKEIRGPLPPRLTVIK